ncbi:MAG: hypothetical protein WBG58_05220 [Ignavibacteriaceae bacterium]
MMSGVLYAQSLRDSVITGKVSYKSAENIYVKFDDTQDIKQDDTLFVVSKGKFVPVVKVLFTSSKSISGTIIGKNKIIVDDEVLAFIHVKPDTKEIPVETGVLILPNAENEIKQPVKKYSTTRVVDPEVKGRITVQSYSNFSNANNRFDYQRWRYAFKLNANNIGGSNLSYSQYVNFAYRADEWNSISSNIGQAFRVYDLALKYDFSRATSVWIGRHLNRRISNIGSIDGVQFETAFSPFSIGLVVGSRPNLSDMGYNAKLFEYGAYISRYDSLGHRGMYNTFGYFEQTNDYKTDRRFIYLQHSNSIINNTRLFLSTEVDLFKKINGESKSEPSLTSLFISANIRASDYVTFYLSYDARKNVIYYETFKNFIDSLFENETRQGFRSRITVKPIRNLFIGANFGYRFRPGDLKPSNNYGGYITYSMIPLIKSGMTFSYTRLYSSYVAGTNWGLRIYKDLRWGLGLSLGYRNTKYQFTQNIEGVTQQSVSFNINTRLLKPVYINFTYEGVFQSKYTSGRLLVNLSYRF